MFFLDTGLRNVIAKENSVTGELFENYVLSELVKTGYTPKYWRTKSKAEVDFVIENGKLLIPIEVKIKPRNIEPSLKAFIEAYKPKEAFIIFFNGNKKIIRYKGCKVTYTDIIGLIDAFKK